MVSTSGVGMTTSGCEVGATFRSGSSTSKTAACAGGDWSGAAVAARRNRMASGPTSMPGAARRFRGRVFPSIIVTPRLRPLVRGGRRARLDGDVRRRVRVRPRGGGERRRGTRRVGRGLPALVAEQAHVVVEDVHVRRQSPVLTARLHPTLLVGEYVLLQRLDGLGLLRRLLALDEEQGAVELNFGDALPRVEAYGRQD